MENYNPKISQSFPPHNVSRDKKQQNKFGLQIAKAIWFFNDSYAPTLFYNDRELYDTYIRYAFGQQDTNQYKPVFGINPNNQDRSMIGGIRWANKNFATKRINTTISKVYHKQYDPVADAIDPVSIDRKESFKAAVKTWMEQQEWLAERQEMLGVNMMPEGVDMSSLPLNDEELEVNMQNDYKLNEEIDLELGVQHHLNTNDFQTLKEQIDFYLTVLPVSGVWVGLNSEGFPVVEVLNPARILAPRSEFGDFKRMAYCGYVDDYTVAEFRQMADPYLSKEKIEMIIRNHAKKGGHYYYGNHSNEYPDTQRDVDKISIMHFEWRTQDEITYLERMDKFGNDRFVEKPYGYYGSPQQMDKFRNKYRNERKIHRVSYPNVYGGWWVVGSEEVFGYGEHNYCNGELGYKLRATNMHEGYSTCLLKQMIPSLDLLETYDKKIQQVVAAAIPKGVFIDLFALRKASFKMGGKDMGPAELLEMYFQKGILVGDTGEGYAAGSTNKPIIELENGMSQDIVRYLELMRHELEVLDEIIGYNRASAGSTLSPETGARVAQQMEVATETALDHIFRADRALCKEIFASLAALHVASVKMNPEHYVQIFGVTTVERLLKSAHYLTYGIDVEARPTQQEWNDFYLDMAEMVKAGKLEPEDKISLRRCQSLKQAYSLMKVLTRRRKKEFADMQTAQMQANAEAQAMSNQQANQNNMMLEDKKAEGDITKEAQKFQQDYYRHLWKLEEIEKQGQIAGEYKLEAVEMQGDNAIAVAKAKPKPTVTKK